MRESSMRRENLKLTARRLWDAFLLSLALPAALYTFCFFVLTYPLIWKWNSYFYADNLDGLQNEWNLWWFRKAIVELHQSPWFTTWLHAPQGTTLFGHTLQPLVGTIGIFLGVIFPRVQVYNLIITGCFVSCGVTAFWLARYVTGQYIPALIGGFAFTFTGFHFAHARGHMELISAEFLPLFLLVWLRFLDKPTFCRVIAPGVVLGLAACSDFNFVFYCILAGCICVIFYLPRLAAIARQHRGMPLYLPLRFGVFVMAALICCGPLLIPLEIHDMQDPFVGAHDAAVYSADLGSAFVPGGVSMLGRYTRAFWSKLTCEPSEQDVYLGLTVVAMAVYGVVRHRSVNVSVGLWIALAVVSYALSLGPVLHFHGIARTGPMMPYTWLETLLPPLKLGGCPSRISVLLALAVSVLASVGVAAICNRHHWTSAVVICAFVIWMVIDLWPIPFAYTPVIYPPWTTALRNLPLKGAVMSRAYNNNPCAELYCQTLYDRPMAFGYISRVPTSVTQNDDLILGCAQNGAFAALRHDFGFVYLVLRKDMRLPNLPIVYSDDTVVIEELPPGTP